MGVFLFTGLLSCEMKEEILGDKELSGETGTLTLGVLTNDETNVITKTTDNEIINQFPVTIYDSKGTVYKEYEKYEDVEDEIRLPVGDYKVHASSPGIIEPRMDEPYFEGETNFTIKSEIKNTVELECKMKNIPTSLELQGDFSIFSTWSVSLDNGKEGEAGSTLVFNHESVSPYFRYWYVGENVNKITVNVNATTLTGERVSQSYSLTKSGANENYMGDDEFFTGGDKLVIKLSPETADIEIGVQIGITVELGFVSSDETTEIPVEIEDGGDSTDPDPTPNPDPDSDPITISEPNGTNYLTDGVTIEGTNYPTDLVILMSTDPEISTIQKVFVKIKSSNQKFEGLVGGMGLTSGDGMDLADEETASSLSTLFPLPQKGSTSYEFSMTEQLFGMLGNFPGTHTFTLKVVDSEGNTKSENLIITIKETTTES